MSRAVDPELAHAQRRQAQIYATSAASDSR